MTQDERWGARYNEVMGSWRRIIGDLLGIRLRSMIYGTVRKTKKTWSFRFLFVVLQAKS